MTVKFRVIPGLTTGWKAFVPALLALFISISTFSAFGTIIPSSRTIPWSRAIVGVPGGIPYRTTIFCNAAVSIPGSALVMVGDGIADNTAALNAAASLCPSNQVIFIPAGNYLFTGQVNVQNYGVTIRGAGTNTVLRAKMNDGSWSFLNIGGYLAGSSTSYSVISGATKGSTNIVVSFVPSWQVYANFATIFMSQGVDYPYVHRTTYTTTVVADPQTSNLQRLSAFVTGTTASTISFWPPLPFDLTNGPVAYSYLYGRGNMFSGVEDLKIQADSADTVNIYFERCFGCWVRNVESSYTSQAHIFCEHSQNGEIRDCYTHDFIGGGGGNNGEGIELYADCTGYLIENNIVYHCFPGINTSGNSSGNVIAYNFGYASHSGSSIIGNDDDANHGAHNVMNLWEGNVGTMFQSDGYYGSCSHNTLFRNYYSGVHSEGLTFHRICIDLTHWTDYFNIVGNVLGTNGWTSLPPFKGGSYTIETNNYDYQWPTIYRFGYPSMGNNSYSSASTNPPTANLNDLDYNVKTTVLLQGNFDYYHNGVVWDPTITDTNMPPSLFYTNTPTWWPTGMAWPPIGSDLKPMVSLIPAQVRFNSFSAPPVTVTPPTPQGLHIEP